jgi:hypothetical protein
MVYIDLWTISMAISGSDLLEVPIPYIYKAYFSGLNLRGLKYGTVPYLHFRILKISH